MGSRLILYRGDYNKIPQFHIHKTSKTSLVGQGIYLTDSEEIAHSYRLKGAPSRKNAHRTSPILWEGLAKDRPDAFAKAAERFLLLEKTPGKKTPQAAKKEELRLKAEFQEMILEGRARALYTTWNRSNSAASYMQVLVNWDRPAEGYLTEFSFPRGVFESSIIKIGARNSDLTFWEIVWENRINHGTPYEARRDFILNNARWSPAGFTTSKSALNAIKEATRPYGYRGFEYPGGLITGGMRHRAFVLWDEEYVNQHKVRRVR